MSSVRSCLSCWINRKRAHKVESGAQAAQVQSMECEAERMVDILEKSYQQTTESKHADADEIIQVMIVDMHTLMREALQRVITTFPQMRVCADLSTLQTASLAAQKTQVQVIILGSCIPVANCLSFIKGVLEVPDPPGIVVIQRSLLPETTMVFIKQGVHSLLGENASVEDLERAIKAAATGNTFLDRCAREMLDASITKAPVHLTTREIEVLSLLKSGESNFRIAHTLGMKEKTLEKHLSHIYEKLHVNSRTGAILQIQRLQI